VSRFASVLCSGLLALGAGCDAGGTTEPPPAPLIDQELRQRIQAAGVIPVGAMPGQNQALADLGQALMFDPILSGNRDIACATCHNPLTHGGDGLSLAIGTGGTGLGTSRTLGAGRSFVPRRAPSLLNKGLGFSYFFWDARLQRFGAFGGPGVRPSPVPEFPPGVSDILTAQAMLPVLNRTEMRGEPGDRDVFGNPNELAGIPDSQYTRVWAAVMTRLLAIPEYVARFNAAFPATPPGQLGFQHAAAAIAAFQKQAFTRTRSPFDRYLDRDDAALTTQQKQGALLFFGKARCSQCHAGPFLGGQSFANVGAPQVGPGTGSGAPLDFGVGDVFGASSYQFAFRVAPLRNVELTPPYFHSGAYPTLEAVVKHYNDVPKALRGFDVTQLAPALRESFHGDEATITAILETLDFRLRTPLDLTTAEQQSLVTFLKALTDPTAVDLSALIPARVPSGLPVPR
jgi:cytochrome c peroxidase